MNEEVLEGQNQSEAPAQSKAVKRLKARRRLLWGIGILGGLLVLAPLVIIGTLTVNYLIGFKTGDVVSPDEQRQQASFTRLLEKTDVKPEDVERVIPTGLAPELGSEDAPVTIVEFIDYQCPFCQRNHGDLRKVMEAMGDQVHLYIRDFPIIESHPDARNVALSANCILEQGQSVYWQFHDQVFQDQEHMSLDEMRVIAERLKVRLDQYDACIAERRYDIKIDKDLDVGIAAGVIGTPTFFINGVKFQGVMDEKLLLKTINYFLEQRPQ